MATIYNSDLSKEMQQAAGLQVSRESIPNQLAEKVVPVMEVNPKLFRRINVVQYNEGSGSGSSTIYTTPTDKDFFLMGFNLYYAKDATNDGTVIRITGTPEDGVAQALISFNTITLTAGEQSMAVMLPIPLKMKRGTTITHSGTFTVGVQKRSATIFGYYVDPTNA